MTHIILFSRSWFLPIPLSNNLQFGFNMSFSSSSVLITGSLDWKKGWKKYQSQKWNETKFKNLSLHSSKHKLLWFILNSRGTYKLFEPWTYFIQSYSEFLFLGWQQKQNPITMLWFDLVSQGNRVKNWQGCWNYISEFLPS